MALKLHLAESAQNPKCKIEKLDGASGHTHRVIGAKHAISEIALRVGEYGGIKVRKKDFFDT
jgi:hypothetical protein